MLKINYKQSTIQLFFQNDINEYAGDDLQPKASNFLVQRAQEIFRYNDDGKANSL